MNGREKFAGSCRLLVHLLRHHDGPMTGIESLSHDDKLLGTASSAGEVLLHTLAIITGADYAEARAGLRSLNMEKRLKEICNEMNAVLEGDLGSEN